MRPIDADKIKARVNERFRCCNSGSIVEACLGAMLDMIDTEPTVATPPNPPLTMEELREMAQDGLAVWCVDTDGIAQGLLCMLENWTDSRIVSHVCILDGECEEIAVGVYSVEYMLEAGARFYRRKPEEEK